MATFKGPGGSGPGGVVTNPFDVDPATGLGGGSQLPDDVTNVGAGLFIKKVVIAGVEKVFGFVVQVGAVSSTIGQAIFVGVAGEAEEAAIQDFINRENAIREALKHMRGGLQQEMGKTDP